MTKAQAETVEMLASEVDNLVVAPIREQALGLPEDGDTLVFEGESQDGPAVGHIDPDGKVFWIAGF
jgi:hypothetical protein